MRADSAAAVALRLDAVSKTFANGTTALGTLSLTVDEGEFVAVVGPSGCGKSTLLRLAAGLDHSTTGSIEVDRTGIGYVFQEPTLLPWRSVQRNVGLLAELSGVPASERKRRVADAISLVRLQGFEDDLPHRLSGGMRMRVSLARALVNRPRLLLLDEPFGALDEITREALQDELLRLRDERGFSAMLITHSVNEAVYLADRVAVMTGRPGQLRAVLDVPFARRRGPELRFSTEFNALAAQVSHTLRGVAA